MRKGGRRLSSLLFGKVYLRIQDRLSSALVLALFAVAFYIVLVSSGGIEVLAAPDGNKIYRAVF